MPKGRTSFFVLLMVFFFVTGLWAQEEEEPEPAEPPIESDWADFMPGLYSRGDQTFIITLGTILPVFFSGAETGTSWFFDSKINMGGAGSLSYNYFLNSHFFIGGELGGMFAGTRGENMLFVIPFGIRGGYQAVLGRFEIPLTLMVGGAPQKKLDEGYFGLIVKGGPSLYWRFNPDWSFGLNAFLWWLPQWTKNPDESMQGTMMEITLSARYHF